MFYCKLDMQISLVLSLASSPLIFILNRSACKTCIYDLIPV